MSCGILCLECRLFDDGKVTDFYFLILVGMHQICHKRLNVKLNVKNSKI